MGHGLRNYLCNAESEIREIGEFLGVDRFEGSTMGTGETAGSLHYASLSLRLRPE